MLRLRFKFHHFLAILTLLCAFFALTPITTSAEEDSLLPLPSQPGPTQPRIEEEQLIKNGSFEAGKAKPRNPRKWRHMAKVIPNGDKRLCNNGTRIVASNGQCAYRFKSKKPVQRGIIQIIEYPVSKAEAGTLITFSFDASTVNLQGAIKARATINAGPHTPEDTIKLKVPAGTSAYTTYTGSMVLQEPLSSFRIRIAAQMASGVALIDNVRLTIASPDEAPAVQSTVPTDGGTDVPLSSNVVITFSEPVMAAPGAFVWNCPDPIAHQVSADATSTIYTLIPDSNLLANQVCMVTVLHTHITDIDIIDPLDTLAEDYAFTFTTVDIDAAPTLISTSPQNGATDVAWDTNLSLQFSESVNVSGAWFTLTCEQPGGLRTPSIEVVVTGNGTDTLTLNPVANLAVGASCEGAITGALVTDVDLNDPPDGMTENPVFSFTTLDLPPENADDAYLVAPNIGLEVPAPGILANDTINSGSIIAPEPNVPFSTIQGGKVTVNADGSFTYDPPAGARGISDSFTYTIDNGSGQDTALVTLTLEDRITPWFVKAGAAPGGNGTLAAPFDTIAAYNAVAGGSVVRTGDIVFLHSGAYTETGIILKNNQSVYGQGMALDTVLTSLPPYSRALPAAGTRPTLSTFFGAGVVLAQNNTLRGFNIKSTATWDISGLNVGTLTIRDVALLAGGGAFNVSLGGTLDVIFDSVHANGTGAFNLNNTTGTLTINAGELTAATGDIFIVNGGSPTITYSGNISTVGDGLLVRIQNTTGGTITFTNTTLTAVNGAVSITNAADVRLLNVTLSQVSPVFDDEQIMAAADTPADGNGLTVINSNVTLEDMTITGFAKHGVEVIGNGGANTVFSADEITLEDNANTGIRLAFEDGNYQASITDSTFKGLLAGGLDLNASNTGVVCARIEGNTVTSPLNLWGIQLGALLGTPTIRLVDYAGSDNNIAAIVAFLGSRNTLSPLAVVNVLFGTITGTDASCN